MNNNQTPVMPLETITASTLMKTEFDPLSFSIEKLLPQGIFILAGSGKIGKSWLALDMCVAVSTGVNCGSMDCQHLFGSSAIIREYYSSYIIH